MIRRHVVVHGRVQGVGFRYAARQEAIALGLAGFARNQADGAVELDLEGPADSVDRMQAWLAAGPPGARVDSVDTTELPPTGESAFRILP